MLARVATNELSEIWPKVEPFLARALAGCVELDTFDLLELLERQTAWLLVDQNCTVAVVYELLHFPQVRSLHIIAAGGQRNASNQAVIDGIKAWASLERCKNIEAWCRAPQSRLFQRLGFRPVYEVIRLQVPE